MTIPIRALCIIFLLFTFDFAPAQDKGSEPRLSSILTDSLLANAHIGVSIYDISSNKSLFRHNDTLLFTPASNLKLFTSAAALELLGPSFRFKTQFLCRGEVISGRLAGDLVVIGGGDPLISGRFRTHITEVLEMWADSLVVRGIDEIDGNIVVDNSLFVGAELGPGWSWDDLTYWYACPISALSFNDNCVDLKFLPGQKPGDPAHIECDPNTDYIITHNNAYTLPAESSLTLDYYRTPNTNEITFFGGIPASDTAGEIDYVSVHRPAMYAAHVFADILAARDVRLKGALVLLDEMPGSEKQKYSRLNLSPLFDWQSDTLGVVLKVINTNSQNFFAEQTLKMLGASFESEGSFKGGVRAARRVFEKFGIDSTQLMMMDGSGLSYINAVTPRAITRLLERMAARPNFGLYYESLGNPAKDRSVRKRLVDVPNRENVRAKTGNIAGASTFSGYVLGPRTNHMIAFSVMVNHFTCHRTYVEDWEDAIIAELLRSY